MSPVDGAYSRALKTETPLSLPFPIGGDRVGRQWLQISDAKITGFRDLDLKFEFIWAISALMCSLNFMQLI